MSSDTNPYVVLITGSRTWPAPEWISEDLEHLYWLFEQRLVIRHGLCPDGADDMAKNICDENRIAQDQMPADWNQFGKRAGFVRNADMVNKDPKPNLCIAYIHNDSRGGSMCAKLAEDAGIYVLRREIND